MSSIPTQIPEGLVAYGRSPDFHSDNLPAKLQSAHSTKAGTWGLLHLLEGTLRYCLEPPHDSERILNAGDTVVIEPEMPHRVEFITPGRMFVEFYRKETTDAG